mgnify:CR=1 FL=1
MPSISKQFHLEVTVRQFLDACDLVELQEVRLLIDQKIRIKEAHKDPVWKRLGNNPKEVSHG